MKRSFLILIYFTFCQLSNRVYAHSPNDSIAFPTSGYDTTAFNPAFLQSSNGRFNLHIGGYTQFRYNLSILENTPDTIETYPRGYSLARTRLFFEGDFTDKFYYHFRANINANSNVELMVAYLQWNLKDNMSIRFGKQFMALGREDWILPQNLASIGFSAHDFTFAIWTSLGVQFHHTVSPNIRYWLSVGNGAYGSRRSFPDPKDSDLAFTGRLDWNILGSNWDIYDDMLGRKGQEFGMLVGLGAGHNTRFNPEALLTSAKTEYQLNLDYTISGSGYQFYIHGSLTNFNYSTGTTYTTSTNGLYSTFGYWFTDQIFSYARFDYVGQGDQTGATESYASPGIGTSFYPFTWTNRIRFTLEYNHLSANINNTIVEPDGMLGLVRTNYGGQQAFRFQAQFGF